jgi:hypothetical protein
MASSVEVDPAMPGNLTHLVLEEIISTYLLA